LKKEKDMRHWTAEDFDQYMSRQMDSRDASLFAQALASDASLAEAFHQHQQLVSLMQQGFKRKELRRELKKIHREAISSKQPKSKIRQLINTRIFNLSAHIAAAATVAALVTFGVLYLTDGMGIGHKDAYMELRNEMNDIYSVQESLQREIKHGKQPPVRFTGTSFAVSSDGLLATNYHVIRGLDSVWVSNFTDSLVRYTAKIVYANPATDIALLRIADTTFKGFGVLPYTLKSQRAEMGEYVFTLGFSKQDVVFGEGSISSVSGYFSDTSSYQVSVPVNPGNSGGPLFDHHGNLIGMVSGKNAGKDGVGFAIKSEYLLLALADLDTSDPDYSPVLQSRNRIQQKKRTEQLRALQPLVFRVQIAR